MEFKKLLYLKCSFRVCFIIITNLYCIPTYLLWMWFFLLPFRILNFPTYWYVEGVMYRWLLTVVASWSWGAGYQIVELGDDINSCTKDRCLFLVNHQSTADVPLLMQAFSGKSVLQSVMWIMDRMFRYTNFGAVSVTHGDYFITQGKNTRDHQMKKLRDHLLNIFIGRNRRWIILFPEGGFLSKRKETSLKYALKNNFPVLEHVTLPRVGAMDVILDTLRPEKIKEALENGEGTLLTGTEEERMPLKWVIDVTMAYPEPQNPLDLVCICAASRPPCITYMCYRRYAIEDVPYDNIDSMRDWVFDRWAEKDELLREYYSTKQFPLSPKIQQINKRSMDNCRENSGTSKEGTDTFEKSTDSLKKSTDASEESPDILKSSTHTLTESPDILKLSTGTFNPNLDFSRQSKNNLEERKTSLQKNIESSKNAHVIHVPMSNAWIIFLHIFFISSTLFHMYVLHNMWNLIPGKC